MYIEYMKTLGWLGVHPDPAGGAYSRSLDGGRGLATLCALWTSSFSILGLAPIGIEHL